jgi:DNA-binding MarR family transcriptional regulator
LEKRVTEIEQLDAAISTLLRLLMIDERRSAATFGSLPFNLIDLETLSFLHRHPGSLAKNVATYLGVRSTTMQSVIERLHKRGLLLRDRDALKGRAIALSLTKEGLEFRNKMQQHNLKNCQHMLATLAVQDRIGFVRNMTTIATALE